MKTWVCDGCMRYVTRPEVAVWADYEHVLCHDCNERYKPPTGDRRPGPTRPRKDKSK